MMERLTDEQLTAELDGRIALRDSYIKHGYHGTAAAYDATIMALTELKEWRMAAPQLPQPAVVYEHGLLPCPFCGGRPEEDAGGCSEYDGHEHQDYSINCKICGAEVYCAVGSFEKADVPCSCHHNTRSICVDKWNRRAGMLKGVEPVSQPYTLPEGMVIVPVEPTREMRLQIHPIAESTCTDCGRSVTVDCEDNVLLSWADMIAAAPQQQEVATDNTTQQFESLGLIVTSDERKMEPPRCSKHPETELQVHPFEQLLSYPPQPVMYCPLCRPSVAKWVEFDNQLRQWKGVK